jgi:hypothetical protein
MSRLSTQGVMEHRAETVQDCLHRHTDKENQVANSRNEGAWVVVTADGDVIIESSEIKALRAAVTNGGAAKFVKYGQSVNAPDSEPTPTTKKAAPKTAPPVPTETGTSPADDSDGAPY